MAPFRFSLVILSCLLCLSGSGADNPPRKISYCTVLSSPRSYDKARIETDVIFDPTYHALDAYGLACPPLASNDTRAQVVLPDSWDSTPIGNQLQTILKRERRVKVGVVAIFAARGGPYGPSVAPFRLTIERLISVEELQAKNPR